MLTSAHLGLICDYWVDRTLFKHLCLFFFVPPAETFEIHWKIRDQTLEHIFTLGKPKSGSEHLCRQNIRLVDLLHSAARGRSSAGLQTTTSWG